MWWSRKVFILVFILQELADSITFDEFEFYCCSVCSLSSLLLSFSFSLSFFGYRIELIHCNSLETIFIINWLWWGWNTESDLVICINNGTTTTTRRRFFKFIIFFTTSSAASSYNSINLENYGLLFIFLLIFFTFTSFISTTFAFYYNYWYFLSSSDSCSSSCCFSKLRSFLVIDVTQ